MTWYYKAGDQEFGPVNKSQLQQLIKAKKISGKTMIRSAPTAPWRPLAEMVRPASQSAASQQSAAPVSGASQIRKQSPPAVPTATATASVPSAVCSQCGRSYPRNQVVTFGDQVICAACEPMFAQRPGEEEGSASDTLNYGGFWIRFGAKLIDLLIFMVTRYIVMIPVGMMLFSTPLSQMEYAERLSLPEFSTFLMIRRLMLLLIPAIYNTFFVGRYAATLGKMACGLKVVTPDGGKVSYMRALGRNFAEVVSWITLTIGYIVAAFDPEKRGLHDRIASTRVVYKE